MKARNPSARPAAAPAPSPSRDRREDNWIRAAAVGLICLALGMSYQVGQDTFAWVGKPWCGFPMHPNGVLSVPVLSSPAIRAITEDLRPQDRVVAVNGQPVASGAEVRALVQTAGIGSRLRYTVVRPYGAAYEVELPVVSLSRDDLLSTWLPLLVSGLLFGLVGSVPILVRPDLTVTRLLFVSGYALLMNFNLLAFDFFFGWRFAPWQRVGGLIGIATLFHLALRFPEVRRPLRNAPKLTLGVIYGTALSSFLLFAYQVGQPGSLSFAFDFGELLGVLIGLAALIFNIVSSAVWSSDPLRRQQGIVLLTGLIAAALPMTAVILDAFEILHIPYLRPIYPIPILVAAGLFTYATVQQNLFQFDAILRQSLTILILVGGAALAYGATLLLALELFGYRTAWVVVGLPGLVLLGLLPVAWTLRAKVEATVEQILFPGQRRARAAIRDATRDLARHRDSEALTRYLRDLATASFAAPLHLLVGKPGAAVTEVAHRNPRKIEIDPADPLYAYLQKGQSFPSTPGRGREGSGAARKQAAELGIELLIAFPPSDRAIGGLALEARTDGRLYTADDQVLLETLAGHVGIALDNARAWDEIRALESRRTAEALILREEVAAEHGFGEIIGHSPPLAAAIQQVQQVAPTDANVMVIGETGTGKELIVRAIHGRSRRAEQPLIKVACAALPEGLLESELFGHERGAFTGAIARKLGRFEVAHGGTIFFDDVDALPGGVQAKLLRVLQEGEVQRLGSNEIRQVDVRVIAATNRDLLGEVRAGRFREDLYYRLNVVPIYLPPLRARLEDLPELVEHFVRAAEPRIGRTVRRIPGEVMTALRAYPWPGNVRELRNVIERALVFGTDDTLRLPGPLVSPATPDANGQQPGAIGSAPMADLVRDYKIQLIRQALEASQGNQRMAAELLGLHRPSLTRMIKDLGLGSTSEDR